MNLDRKTELRVEIPREIADVLDGVSLAQDMKRTELVSGILESWARAEVHKWTVLGRVARLHPVVSDSNRQAAATTAANE